MKSLAYKYSKKKSYWPPVHHTRTHYSSCICAPVLVLAFSRLPCHVPVPSTENWSIQKQLGKNITNKKYNSKIIKFLSSMQGSGNGWRRGKTGREDSRWYCHSVSIIWSGNCQAEGAEEDGDRAHNGGTRFIMEDVTTTVPLPAQLYNCFRLSNFVTTDFFF